MLGGFPLKVLVLDFDGVVNGTLFWQKESEGFSSLQVDPAHNFDPEAIERVNRLVEATGAEVVISSDWRLFYDTETLTTIFKSLGARWTFLGSTPESDNRAREILSWLDTNSHLGPFTRVVVLDDWDPEGALQATFPEGFIHTDLATGFTEEDLKEALKRLG